MMQKIHTVRFHAARLTSAAAIGASHAPIGRFTFAATESNAFNWFNTTIAPEMTFPFVNRFAKCAFVRFGRKKAFQFFQHC